MEPDHVKENPDSYLTYVAAVGDIGNGQCGRDDLGHALLAERSQAERASSAWQSRFSARLRPASVKFAAGCECEQQRVRMALSGRSASAVTLTRETTPGAQCAQRSAARIVQVRRW
jgi:hypothetical protein